MLPDDVPTEITKLAYADHRDLVRAGMPVLSQNQTAAVLAAYWPAIEAHVRADAFREAARVVEALGHDDDAVAVLDNIASGITAFAAPAGSGAGQ